MVQSPRDVPHPLYRLLWWNAEEDGYRSLCADCSSKGTGILAKTIEEKVERCIFLALVHASEIYGTICVGSAFRVVVPFVSRVRFAHALFLMTALFRVYIH